MNIELPRDEATENLILGCCMNDENACCFILNSAIIEDFSYSRNKILFECMRKLFLDGKPIDVALMWNELKKNGNSAKAGGISDILALAQQAYSGIPYEELLSDLQEIRILRQTMLATQKATIECSKPDADSKKIISNLNSQVLSAQGCSPNKVISIADILNDFQGDKSFEQHLSHLQHRRASNLPIYEGISSGYPQLDGILGNFRPGSLYYIGARTSMGKTTFMLNLIKNMADTPIGIFSLEMPSHQIVSKLICLLSDVRYCDYEDATTSTQQNIDLVESSKKIREAKIFIEDPSSITFDKLRLRAMKMKNAHGIKVLFIDYLTRIFPSNKNLNKHLQIDEISKGLQSLAKELNVAIICLAQLNRQTVTKGVKRPALCDFRESGSIEEDADVCLLLHRPEFYDKLDHPGEIEVQIAKNRIRGTTQTLKFACYADQSECYHELSPLDLEIKKAFNGKDYDPDEAYAEFMPR